MSPVSVYIAHGHSISTSLLIYRNHPALMHWLVLLLLEAVQIYLPYHQTCCVLTDVEVCESMCYLEPEFVCSKPLWKVDVVHVHIWFITTMLHN